VIVHSQVAGDAINAMHPLLSGHRLRCIESPYCVLFA